MKIYLIRHAPTIANMTGSMISQYENSDIANKNKPEDWEEKVGKYIPECARSFVISSPAMRCINTALMLFNKFPYDICYSLKEFDCSGLGDKKFWDVTEDEFDKLVSISNEDMEKQVNKFLKTCRDYHLNDKKNEIVCISHGMFIRYFYNYINNIETTAYKVINSYGFRFSNLDLLIYDTNTRNVNVVYYKEPINHKG